MSHERYCILNINRIDVVEENALSQIAEDPTMKGGPYWCCGGFSRLTLKR
jgi:hypothetical protein